MRNKAGGALIAVSIFKMLIYLIYLAASSLSCFMQYLSLWHSASLVTVHGLNCSEPHGILVPGPGIEPMSPALQGGFLTTGPPGRSLEKFLKLSMPRDLQMQSGMDQPYVRMN